MTIKDFGGGCINKLIKKIVFVLGAFIIIAVVYHIVFQTYWFFSFTRLTMPSQDTINSNFSKDKESLVTITEYARGLEYEFISIRSHKNDNGMITISDTKSSIFGEEMQISDPNVIDVLTHLFNECGYNNISKTKNEFIEFQKWSTRNVGCGIVYSYNGEEPNIEFLTILEPLDESGWYYYVSDFDEYRRNRQT